jgi:hypothetical protein
MSNKFDSNENKQTGDYDYDYDSEDSSESNYETEPEELQCKNLDPALAKLMGIIIEEQKEINWRPPVKPGLDNSEKIISNDYLKRNGLLVNDNDYFKVIKDNIVNYRTLSDKQLEYIKNLNNDQKFELIQIYNVIMNNTINALL